MKSPLIHNRSLKEKQLSGAWNFLAVTCKCFINNTQLQINGPDPDWDFLSQVVSRNNLGPVFKSILADRPVPSRIVEKWQQEAVITMVRNMRGRKAGLFLAKILNEANIPFVFMRGMALSALIYPDISFRPMNDIDVLIGPGDREQVKCVLEKNGLQISKQNRSQYVYYIHDILFEIHWSFLTPRRYRSVIDDHQLIQSRRTVLVEGQPISCLSPEDELCGLVSHAFLHHNLDNLVPLLDIALLIRKSKINWDSIAQWARETRLQYMFLFVLTWVNELFDLYIAQEIETISLRKIKYKEKIFHAYIKRLLKADHFSHRFICSMNLLRAAETLKRKFNQVVRFFSIDQFKYFSGLD